MVVFCHFLQQTAYVLEATMGFSCFYESFMGKGAVFNEAIGYTFI
ncbi:hypothetical protein GCM10007111_22890 [Virgibacillus kapii]|uniref:Uncharacterized protein n=1 Tax=Virgibacillus kapii TaxID=1638645 RepID=A0ABQ2DJL6_9BACI|nr:hypothetical protein M948_03025 [Virgibacillus sp. CM-4]GGJ60267.1 hypothetical protein GCM10007111_22890 [Virgibacillus kapii]